MLVSIALAIKNDEKNIVRTLKALQNQTYTDWECIIVDDHSTDNSIDLIFNLFVKKDPRFSLIINKTDINNPYVDAHNLSYKLSKGKYIFRLDSDDIMLPDMIEFQVNFMEQHPEIHASCTCVDRVTYDKYDNIIPYICDINTEEKYYNILNDSITEENCDECNKYAAYTIKSNMFTWFNQSSCIRKSFLDSFSEINRPKFEFIKMGDYIFWWNMLRAGAKLYKHKEKKLLYLIHDDSICHSENFKLYNNEEEYNIQYYIALYKTKAFAKLGNTIFPDGTTGELCSKVFENTANYYKKLIKDIKINE